MMQFKSNKDKVLSQIKQAKAKTIEETGKFIAEKAASNAPVDTGALAKSYTYQVGEDEVLVGSNLEYSIFVELGTSRQPAQPHLVPALEENMSQIGSLAKEAMKINE